MSIGEYDPDGSKNKAEYCRSFLEAMRTHELETHLPEPAKCSRPCHMLKELSGVPFQRFNSIYNSPSNPFDPRSILRGASITPSWSKILRSGLLSQSHTLLELRPLQSIMPDHYFASLDLHESIVEWAGRWNLKSWKDNDPWFFNQTLDTLFYWTISKQALDDFSWYPLSAEWSLKLDAPPPPQWLPTWEPDTEKQAAYIERVRREALLQMWRQYFVFQWVFVS